MDGEEVTAGAEELRCAAEQIGSIRAKSLTGLSHAKPGSATRTRFLRLTEMCDLLSELIDTARNASPE
ncbi:MAG: hypothetical protein Q4C53_00635 [Clostridia bacterium]|nr:hypothetical protein [Clostridia bacterium]